MFDVTVERLISLAEACRLIPAARQGKKTHLSTFLRWILEGARSQSGETVCLEAVRIGGRWMTSREALQRFAERLTLPATVAPPVPPRTPNQRQRASERAAQELEKIGI